jgi:hypothetical protein
MALVTRKRSDVLEYSLLHDVEPVGRIIGRYMAQPIYEAVRDQFGRMFFFAGVAPRDLRGVLDPFALRTGEFILKPGLAYRMSGFA